MAHWFTIDLKVEKRNWDFNYSLSWEQRGGRINGGAHGMEWDGKKLKGPRGTWTFREQILRNENREYYVINVFCLFEIEFEIVARPWWWNGRWPSAPRNALLL